MLPKWLAEHGAGKGATDDAPPIEDKDRTSSSAKSKKPQQKNRILLLIEMAQKANAEYLGTRAAIEYEASMETINGQPIKN